LEEEKKIILCLSASAEPMAAQGGYSLAVCSYRSSYIRDIIFNVTDYQFLFLSPAIGHSALINYTSMLKKRGDKKQAGESHREDTKNKRDKSYEKSCALAGKDCLSSCALPHRKKDFFPWLQGVLGVSRAPKFSLPPSKGSTPPWYPSICPLYPLSCLWQPGLSHKMAWLGDMLCRPRRIRAVSHRNYRCSPL
jgi:hypothetical protein